MRCMLSFRKEDLESEDARLGLKMECPVNHHVRKNFFNFHRELLLHCNHPEPEPDEDSEEEKGKEQKQLSWSERLLALVASKEEKAQEEPTDSTPGRSQVKGRGHKMG